MFSKIGLVPRVISTVKHRVDVSLKSIVGGIVLNPPFILSPMPDCSDAEFCVKFARLGGLAFLHRFCTIEKQAAEYASAIGRMFDTPHHQLGCAVGITGDNIERVQTLYRLGCRVFVLDTANGAHQKVFDVIEGMRKNCPDAKLMVGNVNSADNFYKLADLENVCWIRCGIGGGANCTTSIETGISSCPVNLIKGIKSLRYEVYKPSYSEYKTKVNWDGGIKTPGDVCKAFALGYTSVMMGSVFAACSNSPAKTYRLDGKLYKVLRGNASYSTQQEHSMTQPTYVEGSERLVPMGESLEKTMQRFINGIKSCCSYFNAHNLDEFRKNVTWETL